MGSQFLTALAKKLGRNTLQHIRSAANGTFTHALKTSTRTRPGAMKTNPLPVVRMNA
jgi:hypothetical protein